MALSCDLTTVNKQKVKMYKSPKLEFRGRN